MEGGEDLRASVKWAMECAAGPPSPGQVVINEAVHCAQHTTIAQGYGSRRATAYGLWVHGLMTGENKTQTLLNRLAKKIMYSRSKR